MKKLYIGLMALGLCTFGTAQISEVQDFENGIGNWSFDGGYAPGITATRACEGESFKTNIYSGNSEATLTSPSYISDGTEVLLAFDYKVLNYNTEVIAPNDFGTITTQYNVDGGDWIDINVTSTPVETCTNVDLSDLIVPAGNVQFRFFLDRAVGDVDVYIDNVTIVQGNADVDNDLDGFTIAQGDCDDTDPNINPDAVEILDNDVDENCDGIIGLSGADCASAIMVGSLPYTTTGNTADYGDNYDGLPGTDCGTTNNYLNGDDVVYSYTNNTDTEVIINLNATPTANYAGMFIYNSCDAIGNACAVIGDQNGGNTNELEINELSVAGNSTVYVVISTWAAPQSTEYTLNITENTCTSATYESTIVADCENDQYSIEFEVTDLGTATSLNLNDGTTSQTVDAVGTYIAGPYSSGTSVDFTLTGEDANCDIAFTETYTCPPPPPANDNCSDATALTVGADFAANAVVGTNLNATGADINSTCNGDFGGEVWYSVVVPESGNVTIEVNGVEGSDLTDSVLTAFNGTCEDLVQVGCDDDSSESGAHPLLQLTDQNAGDVIYVAVYEYGNNSFGEFQLSAYDNTVVDPTCEMPMNVSATGITDTTATLEWSGATEDDNMFQVIYVLAGETPDEANAIDVTGLTYSITDLTAETAYDAYVRTDCSEGVYSEWAQFNFSTIASEAPVCGDPIELTVSDETISSANLSWTAVGDVSDFEVIVVLQGEDPLTGDIMTVNGTAYQADGLNSNTVYDFYVRALCSEDVVSSWVMGSFMTLEELVCADPTNVMVSDITDTTANFTWSSDGDEMAWEVIIEEVGVVIDENTATMVDMMSYNAMDLNPETDYAFYVRAVCADDFVSAFTVVNFMTMSSDEEPTGCAAPTNVVVTNTTANSITVSYDLPAGALLDGKAGTEAVQVMNPQDNRLEFRDYGGSSFTVPNLSPGTEYFWVVRSDCGADNIDVSPWSEVYSATTLSDAERAMFSLAPTSTLYPNPATSVVRINGTNATTVLIYDFNGTQVRSLNTSDNKFDVTGLPTGQYNVKIIDADGNVVSSRLLKQ